MMLIGLSAAAGDAGVFGDDAAAAAAAAGGGDGVDLVGLYSYSGSTGSAPVMSLPAIEKCSIKAPPQGVEVLVLSMAASNGIPRGEGVSGCVVV